MGLPGQGSLRSARTNRTAQPWRADRETHRSRTTQTFHRRFTRATRSNLEEAIMPFDYTDAPSQLIPDGTITTVSIHVRPGGVGEDNMLKRSTNGECEMLDLEFTVLDGTYKGRKFWHNLLLVGTTNGQKQMAASNLGVLKTILDSALGLMPNDV